MIESRPNAWQTTNKTDIAKYRDLPVYKHTTSSLEGALNKSIGFREMLKQILILYIVHLHSHVLEAIKQTLLYWELQHSKHVCDTSFSQ